MAAVVVIVLAALSCAGVAAADPAGAPAAAAPPGISGTPRVFSTLTCSTGTWDQPVTTSTQWLVDGVVLGGAEAATLAVPALAVGHELACRVTATGVSGATGSATSAVVRPQRALQKVSARLQTVDGVNKACGASLARPCTQSRLDGSSVRVGGVLAPVRGAVRVSVLYERRRGTTWVLSMSRLVTTDAAGRYKVLIPSRFYASAMWRVSARLPQSDSFEAARSAFRFVQVSTTGS